jgi:hypothetical protein
LVTFADLPGLAISSSGEEVRLVDAALPSHGLSRSVDLESPYQSAIVRSVMLWYRRFDDQPAHRWLRETIASAAEPSWSDFQSEGCRT